MYPKTPKPQKSHLRKQIDLIKLFIRESLSINVALLFVHFGHLYRCLLVLQGLPPRWRILEGGLPPVADVVFLPLDNSIEVLGVFHEHQSHDYPEEKGHIAHVQTKISNSFLQSPIILLVRVILGHKEKQVHQQRKQNSED